MLTAFYMFAKTIEISPCLSKIQLAKMGAFLLRHTFYIQNFVNNYKSCITLLESQICLLLLPLLTVVQRGTTTPSL